MDAGIDEFSIEADPLDLVEHILAAEEIIFERIGDQEIHFAVPGQWCDHPVWFAWRPEPEVLHLCLGVDARVQNRHRARVCDLLARINERLPAGHFDLESEDGNVLYRHALLLPNGIMPPPAQLAAMTNMAREAAEKLLPAINFVLWADKSPAEAVEAAMFETVGEA